MLCINGLFIVSFVSPKLNEWLWWNGYLAFDKSHVYVFVIFLCICDSISQWLCVLFQPIYTIFECWFISCLVKSVSERSLYGKKSQFLSKSGFCCYLWYLPLQPGYILRANKLAPLPGNESAHLPWGERQSWRKISVGKQEFYQ